ncbi:hypothetical protein AAFF_G00390670 [Aldrovandia affinis]|uniref:Integrase catalytic domain-containing protein n=1 Tax=Aldrovandia affinis TaxID=143900 RepID=A0AAD7R486_9TELE|nr:hypothetical protein AAFF_G00390670 [Aldrovandia affinis]
MAQANGEVERQNASLLKRIRIAESEGLDWKRELRKYVTVYRSIDHATTGKSPAELLFNRKMRGKLPDISTAQADLEVRDRDAEQKGKSKIYADGRRGAKYSDVDIGDTVLVKQEKTDKLTTPFNTTPHKVVGKAGAKLLLNLQREQDIQETPHGILTDKWIKGNNSKIIILPSNATVGVRVKCRPGLQTPVPAGFYMRDEWTSLICASGCFDTLKMTQCLKDREFYMMGDSTMRQWFHYLAKAVPNMKYMNLHTQEQTGPLMAVDVNNNIILHWRAHAPPLRCYRTPVADLHYMSNEIDSLAGGPRKVVIFNLWAHFTTYPLEYFARRVARIRQAVVALLKRAHETIVVIKSANTSSSKDMVGSDWLALQLDTILRVIFQGIDVAFIDVWQMTSCHYSTDNMHPNPLIIRNEINKAQHHTPNLPCKGALPEGVGHRFQGPTPPGAQSARRTAVSVRDLSHRQTPQSTLPVEVAHRCRCTTSTHPAPADSNGHPRGRHHLATG